MLHLFLQGKSESSGKAVQCQQKNINKKISPKYSILFFTPQHPAAPAKTAASPSKSSSSLSSQHTPASKTSSVSSISSAASPAQPTSPAAAAAVKSMSSRSMSNSSYGKMHAVNNCVCVSEILLTPIFFFFWENPLRRPDVLRNSGGNSGCKQAFIQHVR